jgi:hypothetical protein
MNVEEIKKDIDRMVHLEKSKSILVNDREKEIKVSQQSGELFKHKYDQKNHHTWVYGTREEKLKLVDERGKIRERIGKPYNEKIDEIRVELDKLKDKYHKYFDGIAYDSPYDGCSQMTEFLTVVVAFLEELE